MAAKSSWALGTWPARGDRCRASWIPCRESLLTQLGSLNTVTGHTSGTSVTKSPKQRSRYEVRGPEEGAVFTPSRLSHRGSGQGVTFSPPGRESGT